MEKSDAGVSDFVALCAALGASETGGALSTDESVLLSSVQTCRANVAAIREGILNGADPLGTLILAIRTSSERRAIGQIFTPQLLVDEMVKWVVPQHVSRIVDCGCGSGRFAITAAIELPCSKVIAIDADPLSTLACRANAAVRGIDTIEVLNADFLQLSLPTIRGRTAFIGNPPYVRHHDISAEIKRWGRAMSEQLGWNNWSSLAGLHALFFMAVVSKSVEGDLGCLLTSSEWLGVNYGRAMRSALLNGAGGRSIHVLRPEAKAFDNAMATACITCFQREYHGSSIRIQSAQSLEELSNLNKRGRSIPHSRLKDADSWADLTFSSELSRQDTLVPLGEIARVSRGAVTGGNELFLVTAAKARMLGLSEYFVPAITRAREVQSADGLMASESVERQLLVATPDDVENHPGLKRYLSSFTAQNVRQGSACSARGVWYSVPLKTPSVVATYMGRGRPAFALNPERMPIVNVVHGLYPLIDLSTEQLLGLVNYLNSNELAGSNGRVYQGGLRKFEPKEMERLLVPMPSDLKNWASFNEQ